MRIPQTENGMIPIVLYKVTQLHRGLVGYVQPLLSAVCTYQRW